MIDSVTLRIHDFTEYSSKFFTQEKRKRLMGEYGIFGSFTTRYTNYPQQCAKEGQYFPQVHIIERSRSTKHGAVPYDKHLVVQVSLPKLIFGTSLFDMVEELLPIAADKLSQALKEIQIGVLPETILKATVCRVDYSKILQIAPSYGTTGHFLKTLAPYDIKQSSDFNRSHYHDGKDGFYIKFYNSSQGLVLYDKFDEIVANGKTNLEHEIAREYQTGKWKKGAFRIELSLQKKQTVDAMLRRFLRTKKKNFTLQEAASRKIAKACLVETFEKVYVSGFNRLVHVSGLKDKELVQIIREHAREYREEAMLYYLIRNVREYGLKAAVDDLRRRTSPATVGRHKKAVETVLGAVKAAKDTVSPIPYLHRKLKTFRLVLPKKLDAILNSVADNEKIV